MKKERTLRERIDDLDPLTVGVVFAKEEAWKKLEKRVSGGTRKISLFYRIAAAVLILVSGVLVIFSHRSEPPLVKNIPVSHRSPSTMLFHQPQNKPVIPAAVRTQHFGANKTASIVHHQPTAAAVNYGEEEGLAHDAETLGMFESMDDPMACYKAGKDNNLMACYDVGKEDNLIAY